MTLDAIGLEAEKGDMMPHVCLVCDKPTPKYKKHQKFCSMKCAQSVRKSPKIDKICKWCKKEFSVPDYKGKQQYCSGECGKKVKVGVKPWNYGTALNRELKKGLKRQTEYTNWRKAVLKKNNGKCLKCAEKATNAHHIYFIDFILREKNYKSLQEAVNDKELWDTGNGAPLCRPCHEAYHSQIWYPQSWYKISKEFYMVKKIYTDNFHGWSGLIHRIPYEEIGSEILSLYTPISILYEQR